MKAVYIVKRPIEVHLPPMDSDSRPQLHYIDESGQLCGGMEGCIGPSPAINGAPTELRILDTSDAVNTILKAGGQYPGVVWVEDVVHAINDQDS